MLGRAPGFLLALAPALSLAGSNFGRVALVLALGLGVLSVPGAVIGYLRFRYRLTATEVQIRRGVLAREFRSIPVHRVQRVEIDRPLLARLFGTASVRLMTGGGAGADASLAYVSLADALALRADVRRLQAADPAPPGHEARTPDQVTPDAGTGPDAEPRVVFTLSPGLLLRAGAMRFSLVYIALAFSALQFTQFSPEDLVGLVGRLRLAERLPALAASPVLALGVTGVVALALSWLAGLVTTVARFWGFTLRTDARRLYTERGLGARYEHAVPRARVQAVVFTANPVMLRFGYARLAVRTMGAGTDGSGEEILVPLARRADASALARELLGHAVADALAPVSPLFVRRRALRYAAAAAAAAVLALPFSAWGTAALAGVPLGVLLARAQGRAHGYALTRDAAGAPALVVQTGAFWREQQHVRVHRLHTVDVRATVFQARRGLASVFADTAGGDGPTVHDLPADEALRLAEMLRHLAQPQPALPAA
ncbi:MAG: PH domain-containing protein [Rubricoccaceae bacterium]